MNASVIVESRDLADLPILAAATWRENLATWLREGMRLITLFGKPDPGPDVILTAIVMGPDFKLHVARAKVDRGTGYHALTAEFPAAQAFEREMHEQTGLRIAGHPWMKPIRYEGRDQAAMATHPFHRIEGKEVHEVAVGPIHAGIIEPGSFRFMCEGERVHHLEIQLGYQHRGVEGRLLSGDPRRLAPWVETIAGDSSVAYAWAYCSAIERLAGCELDADAETESARAVALELERVAMHLSGMAGLAADLGFLQGASTYGRLRTIAINSAMQLCGSRLGRGAIRPGGIGMRLTTALSEDLRRNTALLQRDLAIIDDRFLTSKTVLSRLDGIGLLDRAHALELGVVGMAARASGIPIDTRMARKGAYGAMELSPVVLEEGDCRARAILRIREMTASLQWILALLDRRPEWNPSRLPIGPLQPDRLAISIVEGWRGEVVHCLETGPAGSLVHYKVQDPSLRNWMGLAMAVRENDISDFPICNKSFDLSYCGNDL